MTFAMREFSLTVVIFGCVSQYVLSQTVYKTEEGDVGQNSEHDLGKDKVTGSEKETGSERTWKKEIKLQKNLTFCLTLVETKT